MYVTLKNDLPQTTLTHAIERPSGIQINQIPNQNNNKSGPQFEEWQSNLSKLIFDFCLGRLLPFNFIISASPAAGKSAPITKGWEVACGQFSDIASIPRILWVCPNKTLTFEKYNDFRKSIIDSILNFFNNAKSNTTPTLKSSLVFDENIIYNFFPNLRHLQMNSPQILQYMNIQTISTVVDQLVGYEMMQNKIDVTKNTIAYSCTYIYAPKILEKFKPKLIVIDELQERFSSQPNESLLDEKVESLLDTIISAPTNCSIILLTGSMNKQSIVFLSEYLTQFAKRKFDAYEIPALNRAYINFAPLYINKLDDIVNLAREQIYNKTVGNLIAIFSTNKIIDIATMLNSKLPKYSPKIITEVSENYIKTQKDLKVNLDKIKNKYSTPEWQYYHLNKMIDSDSSFTKLLAECIQHRFGFIFAPKNPDGSKADFDVNDIILVQELFKQHKIFTVFVTTMVGVGVNLQVYNLYIPTINIAPGLTLSQSDITQLIHRAGRTSTSFATIFCNPKDINFILNALNDTPGNFIAPNLDIMNNKLKANSLTLLININKNVKLKDIKNLNLIDIKNFTKDVIVSLFTNK